MDSELERYRRLVLDSPEAVVVHADRRIVFANPAAEAVLGRDLVGLDVHVFESSHRDLDERLRRREAGETVADERLRLQINGETRWMEARSATVSFEGRPAFQVSLRDVTDRVRAEERERRVTEQLDAVIAGSPALIFIKDSDGRYARVNGPWLAATGLTEADVLGRTQTELFGEYDELWEAKERASMDQTIRTEDEFGGRWFDSVRFPLRDPDGTVYAVCGMAIEITQHKLALSELARSNYDLERFAYVASHDLGEPLRTVTNFATLLSRRYAGQLDEQADTYLGFMTGGVLRMRQMLDGLLAYSRAGREQGLTEVDLAGVVASVLSDLDAAVRAAGARIEVGELPVVAGNRTQLAQIFLNLIANALKFADPARPAEVTVRAEREEDAWRVTIADNGIGIEPRFADRIFEIFQRLHPRGEYDGTGVGLAVVRRLVEARGGTVGVVPGDEQGSVFAFTVPDA